MSDLVPTFTTIVTGTPDNIRQSLNLWKLEPAKVWYLRIHSAGVENKTASTNYVAALRCSLINVLQKTKRGDSVLVDVPLQMLFCGTSSQNTQRVYRFDDSPLFRINNLTSDYFWYLTPVTAKDETVAPDFNKLRVTIHFSLYGV